MIGGNGCALLHPRRGASLIKSTRKHGPDVWQSRWSEKSPSGKRIYRKKAIGTINQYTAPMSRRTPSSRESITSNRTESADPLNASESLSAPGQTRVTILLTSSIHAAPWVVICAAKYLNLQFPTRLITSRS